jgi:hypothetical protein
MDKTIWIMYGIVAITSIATLPFVVRFQAMQSFLSMCF